MSNFLVPKSTSANSSGGGGSGDGSALTNSFVSIGPMSAHKVVYSDVTGVILADKDLLVVQDRILGITTTSTAAPGGVVNYISHGKLVDPSFAFTPGPIYLGIAGALTQIKPTTGVLIQVAIAVTNTEIIVDIQLNVKLA